MNRNSIIKILALSLTFTLYADSGEAQIKEIEFKNPPPLIGPDYLYVPEKLKPGCKYWLVVGVHGAKGRGRNAAGMKSWVTKYPNVIVLGPQFDHNGFQNGNGVHAKKLIKRFKELRKEYPLHDKFFIYGFSGGSQFGHRFVMYNPEYVVGCSAHSGGSWATRIYGKINRKAVDIPFAISCGENDTKKAWGDAPLGRLDWFREFEKEMTDKNMYFKSATWPDKGHGKGPGVDKMTEDCFLLATEGVTSDKKQLFQTKTKKAEELIQEGKFDEAATIIKEIKSTDFTTVTDEDWKDNPTAAKNRKKLFAPILKKQMALLDISPQARARLKKVKAMIALLEKEKKVDTKVLVKFVLNTPPKYWHKNKGAESLIKACDTACREYVQYLKGKDIFTHQKKSKMIVEWEGLPIRNELYNEFCEDANKELAEIKNKPSRSKGYQRNKLTLFIRKWKVGEAVEQAKVMLENL